MPITRISPKHQITIPKEWQAREKEADEAIARGEISEPFERAEELIRHLRKRP